MIVLAPKINFGIFSKNKSMVKAKQDFFKEFEITRVKQGNPDMPPGHVFDFTTNNPIGITFASLYEIYNSIPKNMLENYEEGLRLFDSLDPQNEKEIEQTCFFNLRLREFENFIEDYLNNIRKEEESKAKELSDKLNKKPINTPIEE